MSNILNYKGYSAKILYSAEDNLLYGKIEGISDLITFESDDATKIEHEFQVAVDDYLAFCEQVGKEPDKAYKGVFNVRISPELHRKIAVKAIQNDTSINREVEEAIRSYVTKSSVSSVVRQTVSIMLGKNFDKRDRNYCSTVLPISPTSHEKSDWNISADRYWGYAQ